MGLDETLAAVEAELAAHREAEMLNRAAIDAACQRFAELAIEREIKKAAPNTRSGWVIKNVRGVGILVQPDGSWTKNVEAAPDPTASDIEREMALCLITGWAF